MMSGNAAVRFLCAVLLAMILLAGCGGGSGDGQTTAPDTQTDKADSSAKARILSPVAYASVKQTVVNAANALGIDLLGQVEAENAVVAPFSASLSLARLRAGAAGETKTGISAAMHLDPVTDVNPALDSLDLEINARLSAAGAGQTSSAASRGWVQSRYGYLLTYLDTVAEYFGLYMAAVDFALAPTTAWSAINTWMAQVSPELAGSATLGANTRLVLGDALKLDAPWASPFDPTLTKTEWFRLLDGSDVEASFLHQQVSLSQATGDGYIALELPLAENGLQFLVILPDEGRFSAVAAALTEAKLDDIVAALAPATVDLALPKFAVNAAVTLPVGNGAQPDTADFSALDGTRDLYVTSRTQNVRLTINESGIGGNAVSLLALDDAHPETWTDPNDSDSGYIVINGAVDTGMIQPVAIGRPFLFAVRDAATGAVLFLGRVCDPRQ